MAKIPVSQQLKVMEKHLISTLSNSLIAPRDNNLATITKFIIDTSDLVTNLLEITHGVLIIRPTVHTIHGSYVLPVNTINYTFIPSAHYRDWETDRKSTRLNSSHSAKSRMPSSA